MRYILVAVVGLVAVTWLAVAGPPGGGTASAPEPSPAVAPPPVAPPPIAAPRPPDDAARAALLTIYTRVYAAMPREGARPAGPAALAQLDVVAAANVLAENALEGRDTRRRRAAAVLAAAARPLDPRGERWEPPEFGEALEILGAPREAIARKLDGDATGPPYAEQEQVRREQIVYLVLDTVGGDLGPLCCACLTAFDVDDPTAGAPGMAFFTLDVGRPLADVRQAMDPQGWARCNPQFFSATHAASADACATDDTAPSASPPTPGDAWKGPLFEAFRIGLPGQACELHFDNLLRIDAHAVPGTPAHRIDYGICRSLDGGPSCAPAPTYRIKVDCGYEVGRASGADETRLTAAKFLEFDDAGLNGSMYVGLKAMIDEVRNRGVCCDATAPVACPACPIDVPILEDVHPDAPGCAQGPS